METSQNKESDTECPICGKYFEKNAIEVHVNRCIFLNSHDETTPKKDSTNKRSFSVFTGSQSNANAKEAAGTSDLVTKKKPKKSLSTVTSKVTTSPSLSSSKPFQSISSSTSDAGKMTQQQQQPPATKTSVKCIPLAEKMRPETIGNVNFGQI